MRGAGRDWDTLYRRLGPQRPYTKTPGLTYRPDPGEVEYPDGSVARLADLFGPPRPNWREATDGTLRAGGLVAGGGAE